MEVEELKQVVDSNAVEMREGFAEMRSEMRALRVEIRESGEETRRHLGVVIDRLMSQFELVTEAIDGRVDRKLADFEERLTHKLRKR